MNPLYTQVLDCFTKVSAFEKFAEVDTESTLAQVNQAELCDNLFGIISKYADEHFDVGVLPRKEAMVIKVARCVMSLRDTHAATGTKLAASFDAAADLIEKLAVATFVDQVLEETLEKNADENVRAVQRLGREYAITLMRGLLA